MRADLELRPSGALRGMECVIVGSVSYLSREAFSWVTARFRFKTRTPRRWKKRIAKLKAKAVAP